MKGRHQQSDKFMFSMKHWSIFKGSNGKELVQLEIPNNMNVCQLCNMVGHDVSSCSNSPRNPNVVNVEGGMK